MRTTTRPEPPIDLTPSTRRPRVLLDCDGVLADFVGGMLEIVRELTGRAFGPEHVDRWDFAAALGLSPKDASAVKRTIGGRRGFAANLQPYPDALDGVAALRACADVWIVTAPWRSSESWTAEREAWLQFHFGIPTERIIFAQDKSAISGDVFVDDKASAVEAWILEREARQERGVGVVWSNLHNVRDVSFAPRVQRWEQVLAMVAP